MSYIYLVLCHGAESWVGVTKAAKQPENRVTNKKWGAGMGEWGKKANFV